jgi:hypothetical protein
MQSIRIALLICLIHTSFCFAQDSSITNPTQNSKSALFSSKDLLPIKWSYSNRDIKKNTNDSTYIKTVMSYQDGDGSWNAMDVELRARGNFRLKNCYFPPVKLKIKKSVGKGTLFEGEKRLKVVLPCLVQKDNDDNVIKEYLAYKMFEFVSPYYFKTRLVNIEFEEIRGKKIKSHQIKGFLIEDDKNVAKRFDGNVYDRNVHPLQQDDLASIRNAMFQFMIGNTDFSQVYQHNVKLIFIKPEIIPVPYDFDMAGFINCSYAVVSQIGEKGLGMESVTQRMYRGFKRDVKLFEQVRQEFISNKANIMAALDECEILFDNPREFEVAKDYISNFFDILVNNKKFENQILNQARTK